MLKETRFGYLNPILVVAEVILAVGLSHFSKTQENDLPHKMRII